MRRWLNRHELRSVEVARKNRRLYSGRGYSIGAAIAMVCDDQVPRGFECDSVGLTKPSEQGSLRSIRSEFENRTAIRIGFKKIIRAVYCQTRWKIQSSSETTSVSVRCDLINDASGKISDEKISIAVKSKSGRFSDTRSECGLSSIRRIELEDVPAPRVSRIEVARYVHRQTDRRAKVESECGTIRSIERTKPIDRVPRRIRDVESAVAIKNDAFRIREIRNKCAGVTASGGKS